jgi:hypothetical protein
MFQLRNWQNSTKGSDCASSKCVGNICTAPTCDDNIKNGNETDIDCGGSCISCSDDSSCSVNQDCSSLHCLNSKCGKFTKYPTQMDRLIRATQRHLHVKTTSRTVMKLTPTAEAPSVLHAQTIGSVSLHMTAIALTAKTRSAVSSNTIFRAQLTCLL